MHITRITVENLPPLSIMSFDLDEQVNLFIGPNASGKSTILRAIGLLSVNVRGIEVAVTERPNLSITFLENGRKVTLLLSDEWPKPASTRTPANAVPLTYIPATRVNMISRNLPFSVGISHTSLDIWRNARAKEIEHNRNRYVNDPIDFVSVNPQDESVSQNSLAHFLENQHSILRGYLAQLAVDQLRKQQSDNQTQINRALEVGYFLRQKHLSRNNS